MFEEARIRELTEQRREMQRMYRRAVERYWDIKTRVIAPEKEDIRRKILNRYMLDKKTLNEGINDLGEQIWKMQRDIIAGGEG